MVLRVRDIKLLKVTQRALLSKVLSDAKFLFLISQGGHNDQVSY